MYFIFLATLIGSIDGLEELGWYVYQPPQNLGRILWSFLGQDVSALEYCLKKSVLIFYRWNVSSSAADVI